MYRRSLSYGELGFLIDKIVSTNETGNIVITPSYDNARIDDIDSFSYLWGYEDIFLRESENEEVTEKELYETIHRIRECSFEDMPPELQYVSLNTIRIS